MLPGGANKRAAFGGASLARTDGVRRSEGITDLLPRPPPAPLPRPRLSDALAGITHLVQTCPLGLYNTSTIERRDGTTGMAMRLSPDAEDSLWSLVESEVVSDELLLVFRIYGADFADRDDLVRLSRKLKNRELRAVVADVIRDHDSERAWDAAVTRASPAADGAASGAKRARPLVAPSAAASGEPSSIWTRPPDDVSHSIRRRLQAYVRAFIARSDSRSLHPFLIPAVAFPLVHELDNEDPLVPQARCLCCSLFEYNEDATRLLVRPEHLGGASDELFVAAADAGFFAARLTANPLGLIASLSTGNGEDVRRVAIVKHLIEHGEVPSPPESTPPTQAEPPTLTEALTQPPTPPIPTPALVESTHADSETEPELAVEKTRAQLPVSHLLPTPKAARSLWGGSAASSSPPGSGVPDEEEESSSSPLVSPHSLTTPRSRVCEDAFCCIM